MSSITKSLLTAQAARNYPFFFFFGKRKKKDGRGKILFLSSSSEQRLQYTLMKEKALHHSVLHWLTVDTEWKWAAWEEPFSISEPQGVSPCAIFVREERGGVVRGELSCISSKLQGPQLASTTSITMGFKPGNSSGILFLKISSTWGCLWEKWNLCMCKQVSEGFCCAAEVNLIYVLSYHPTASSKQLMDTQM